MEEILIGEKKYISSRQAAKMTGYAKDYIGQLCREGRVPARLVGRSWYVLESAISDHRFGKQIIEQETTKAHPTSSGQKPFSATWESPRYEALTTESIPSVNRLEPKNQAPEEDPDGLSQHLQDSWKAWFDRVVEATPLSQSPKMAQEDTVTSEKQRETSIPLKTVIRRNPPEDLLPKRRGEIAVEEEYQMMNGTGKSGKTSLFLLHGIRIGGIAIALCAMALATIGSGYLDEYEIISNSRASAISGISIYKK